MRTEGSTGIGRLCKRKPAMNRKHLIQLVAPAFVAAVLYLSSYGPVQGYYGMYFIFTDLDESTEYEMLKVPDAVFWPIS